MQFKVKVLKCLLGIRDYVLENLQREFKYCRFLQGKVLSSKIKTLSQRINIEMGA